MAVILPAPVQAFFDATNAGDTDAFLAAFADDAVVDDWGRTFQGHEAIKGWSDGENIGVHATFDVTEVVEKDGSYVVTAVVGGGGFNGPSHFTFQVADGHVTRMTITA
ncbi:nuclear transport factor 2 family protein [Actinoplanes sp. M2I2]|uniref:nuclear transport factor 2 family protein n=1 Tax=Actinoplanes sp. M2I2 TaxID=1734444 RepID=UPI0020213629|nr:nuclear transport factor 2 family protein [Actinoplanes sp. M2I2]